MRKKYTGSVSKVGSTHVRFQTALGDDLVLPIRDLELYAGKANCLCQDYPVTGTVWDAIVSVIAEHGRQ